MVARRANYVENTRRSSKEMSHAQCQVALRSVIDFANKANEKKGVKTSEEILPKSGAHKTDFYAC